MIQITDQQAKQLAYPLISIVTEFFKDPENVRKFEIWKKKRRLKDDAYKA